MIAELCANGCTLISGRLDVIRTFLQIGEKIEEFARFDFIKPGLIDGIERTANRILLDISSISRFSDFDFAEKILSVRKIAFFLVPPDTPFFRRKLIYDLTSSYADFPIELEILNRKLRKFIAEYVQELGLYKKLESA
ncbi:MAG: hypothetical protein K6A43_04325 [Treponema sp.]|nr:hypothetical protein [Treponema sp.]